MAKRLPDRHVTQRHLALLCCDILSTPLTEDGREAPYYIQHRAAWRIANLA
jgi:hypothetical protein